MSDQMLYGPDRVRRIRIGVGAAAALGGLCGVFAILIAFQADEDGASGYAAMLGVIAAVTIVWSLVTWKLLAAPDRNAKRAVIVTGVLSILFSLPTFRVGVGLLLVVLGMVLIFLALVDDEDAST